mmetsp:Transcript_19311/g.23835  ORF Transcript_19311/g.23835 Transcript_19311/m.23835 type:complete len:400 (-) Transcript_19311:10-1209(-)
MAQANVVGSWEQGSPVASHWDFEEKQIFPFPGRELRESMYSRLIPQHCSGRIVCVTSVLLFLLVLSGKLWPSGTVALTDREQMALWRANARFNPSQIPNASFDSTPWIIHRFARGNSPQMCLQCVMIPDFRSVRRRLDVLQLQIEYARRHGYDLYTYVGDGEDNMKRRNRHVEWYKLRSTQDLIESGTTGCDYIFWMDQDSVINNMSFALESLINWNGLHDTDAVLTADTLGVNSAQSLWKTSRFTRDFMVDAWSMWRPGGAKENVPLHANGALAAIYGGCQPSNSVKQKQECYFNMDLGWRDRSFAFNVYFVGDNKGIGEVVRNKSLLPRTKWVARHVINSYPKGVWNGKFSIGDPDFIVRCFSLDGDLMIRPYLDAALQNAGLKPNTSQYLIKGEIN